MVDVRRPISRQDLSASVAPVSAGMTVMEQQGPCGAGGFVRQALAPLPNFSGQYPVVGSLLIEQARYRLSIREDENPITGNTARLLPHAIL